jgi:hypothetical protein
MSMESATLLVPGALTAFLVGALALTFRFPASPKLRIMQTGLSMGALSGIFLCAYWFTTVLPEGVTREITGFAWAGFLLSVIAFILLLSASRAQNSFRGLLPVTLLGALWLYSMFVVYFHD